MLWDTRIARNRGTVSDEGLNEGERYSTSSSEGKAMTASRSGITVESFPQCEEARGMKQFDSERNNNEISGSSEHLAKCGLAVMLRKYLPRSESHVAVISFSEAGHL